MYFISGIATDANGHRMEAGKLSLKGKDVDAELSADTLTVEADTLDAVIDGDVTIDSIKADSVHATASGSVYAKDKSVYTANITAGEIILLAQGNIGTQTVPLVYDMPGSAKAPVFSSAAGSVHVMRKQTEKPVKPTGGGSGGNAGSGKSVWESDGKGWKHRGSDGRYIMNSWAYLQYMNNSYWYIFDKDGYMRTGWYQNANGQWFYLSEIHDGWYGHMLTGWQLINGRWYFLQITKDSTEGTMLTGWQLINGVWYYFSEAKDSTEGMLVSAAAPAGTVPSAAGTRM